jgi:UPF0271 protein
MYIDLNCDMGEGMPTDAGIMPYISSANIACGYHAGDKTTMEQTVSLALQYGVAIGAHPGFDDKANFGRTEQQLADQEVYDLITAQIYSLQEVCRSLGATLQHVKPHGALYNMAARDQQLSTIIAKAIRDTNPALCLFGLSNSWLIKAGAEIGLKTASEVFADRTYQEDGSLTPRSQPNALIENEADALAQVIQMVTKQEVTTISGKVVPLRAETICLHGDGAHAVIFAKAVHQTLQRIQHS